MVYNHTGEGNTFGPTLSLKGLANPCYYRLDPRGRSELHRLHGLRQHAEHVCIRKSSS